MNNLLPRDVEMHYKFDLKGSRYKRKANSKEQQKKSPTWKDLDFERIFDSKRISLVKESYNAMIETIKRDCLVLNSFSIMDYRFVPAWNSTLLCAFSFLMGVHKCSVGEIASMESMSLSASNSRGNSGTGSLVKRKRNKKSFHKVSVSSSNHKFVCEIIFRPTKLSRHSHFGSSALPYTRRQWSRSSLARK